MSNYILWASITRRHGDITKKQFKTFQIYKNALLIIILLHPNISILQSSKRVGKEICTYSVVGEEI